MLGASRGHQAFPRSFSEKLVSEMQANAYVHVLRPIVSQALT